MAGLLGYRLSPDGSRAAIVVSFYGPAQATFPAAVAGGATLKMDTEYPFEDAVRLLVQAPRAVDVDLRIPGWAGAASVSLDGGPPVAAARGAFHTVRCAPGGCAIVLLLAPAIEVTPGWGTGDGVAVTRGPLLFALPLAERWTALRSYEFIRNGPYLKCSAIHVATGREVSAMGPVNEPKSVERVAIAKLRRALGNG